MARGNTDQQALLIFDLLKHTPWNEQGPRTRLLSDSGDARLVLLTLRAGQEIKEHRSPGQLMVQVVDGCVVFTAADQSVTLTPVFPID